MCSGNAKFAWSVTFTTNTWSAYHSCMRAGSQPLAPTNVISMVPSERLGRRIYPSLNCFMLGVCSGQPKKSDFLTYNPQRTWERMSPETIDMQRMQRRVAAQNQLEPPAGHHRNFQYPFPTQPHEYMQLQNKPSGARIEELQQAWVENENFRPDVESDASAVGLSPRHSINRSSSSRNRHRRFHLMVRRGVAWQNHFHTVFRGAREGGTLFDQSLEHYESVFAVPEELAMEEEYDRFVKELESWRSKVVVDDLCFHSTFVSRKQPGQIDKHQLMLHGPRKCVPDSPQCVCEEHLCLHFLRADTGLIMPHA